MKILLYSDVHISRTSSILPTIYKDTNYTYRQAMIIQTAKWISKLAKENNPNIIINLGDTFDQHTLTSYDTEIARQFFSEFQSLNIPHYVVIGNHEMINEKFNAVAMLDNVNNINVIQDPQSIEINNCKLAFLPYRNYKDIQELPEGDFLFSHNDIYGSTIRRSYKLDNGIDPNILKQKYKLVFNGHIHKNSIFSNVINVGSCTTHSFADDNDWQPQVYIFDTETLDLETFVNTNCPLFKTYDINSIDELNNIINNLNKQFKYVIHITCPFELKNSVKTILTTNKTILNNNTEQDFILNSKLNVKIETNKELLTESLQVENEIKSNLDINKSFKDFLEIIDLKYPKQLYLDIVNIENVNKE